MRVYVTIGEDGKGVISSRPPLLGRMVGTRRRALYQRVTEVRGEFWGPNLWITGQCLEGIQHELGFLPEVNVPAKCRLTLEADEAEAPAAESGAEPSPKEES